MFGKVIIKSSLPNLRYCKVSFMAYGLIFRACWDIRNRLFFVYKYGDNCLHGRFWVGAPSSDEIMFNIGVPVWCCNAWQTPTISAMELWFARKLTHSHRQNGTLMDINSQQWTLARWSATTSFLPAPFFFWHDSFYSFFHDGSFSSWPHHMLKNSTMLC